jgi:hypothetical protein
MNKLKSIELIDDNNDEKPSFLRKERRQLGESQSTSSVSVRKQRMTRKYEVKDPNFLERSEEVFNQKTPA